jgi:hypothetical protein
VPCLGNNKERRERVRDSEKRTKRGRVLFLSELLERANQLVLLKELYGKERGDEGREKQEQKRSSQNLDSCW